MVKTFYTIQNCRAWTEAQTNGFLSGNPEFIDDGFINPYLWMMKQMNNRINVHEHQYPIWLWSIRPDLRRTGYLKKGTKAVLLEIEISNDRVLLSGFQAWHCVLNRWTLEDHKGEDISMEKSWERIFDLEYLKIHPDWGQFNELDIQGVTGKIYLSQIKSVKLFTCK
jgi:hypothetical protein